MLHLSLYFSGNLRRERCRRQEEIKEQGHHRHGDGVADERLRFPSTGAWGKAKGVGEAVQPQQLSRREQPHSLVRGHSPKPARGRSCGLRRQRQRR